MKKKLYCHHQRQGSNLMKQLEICPHFILRFSVLIDYNDSHIFSAILSFVCRIVLLSLVWQLNVAPAAFCLFVSCFFSPSSIPFESNGLASLAIKHENYTKLDGKQVFIQTWAEMLCSRRRTKKQKHFSRANAELETLAVTRYHYFPNLCLSCCHFNSEALVLTLKIHFSLQIWTLFFLEWI